MNNDNFNKDFFNQINDAYRLTTIEIIYRMPDYLSILQEYIWQTLDRSPDFPRIYAFLEYWEKNIEAPIYSVKIANKPISFGHNIKWANTFFKI